MTSATEHILSTTAVGATVASIMGWLQGNLSILASLLSVVWLGIQIIFAIQNQNDRRRLLRLQAVQDTHAMARADAVTAAIQEKPVVPVVIVSEPSSLTKPTQA